MPHPLTRKKKVDTALLDKFGTKQGVAQGLKTLEQKRPEEFQALSGLRSGQLTRQQVGQGLKKPTGFVTQTQNLQTGQKDTFNRFGQPVAKLGPTRPTIGTPRAPTPRPGLTTGATLPQQRATQQTQQRDAFKPTTPTGTPEFVPDDVRGSLEETQQRLSTAEGTNKQFFQSKLNLLNQVSQIADEAERNKLISAINSGRPLGALSGQITGIINRQGPTTIIDGKIITRATLENDLKTKNEQLNEARTQEEADQILQDIRDIEERRDDLTRGRGRQEEAFDIQSDQRLRGFRKAARDAKQNLGFLRGTSGFAQAEGAIDAAEDHVINVQKTAKEMAKLTSIERAGMEDEFEIQMRDLDQIISDSLNSVQQDALRSIQVLDSRLRSGQLSRSDFETERRGLMNKLTTDFTQNAQNAVDLAKLSLNAFDKKIEVIRQQKADAAEAREIDVAVSNSIGDGIARNSQGAPVTDEFGNPIRLDPTKPVQNVLKNPDGSTTILFKDGTHETQRFGLPVDVTNETVQSFATLVNRGQMDINDVPPAFQESVVNKLAMLDPISGKERFLTAGGGKVFDTQTGQFVEGPGAAQATGTTGGAGISGTTPAGSPFSITAGTTQAIPDALNNPGDIKRGGIGDKFASKDADGNLVLNQRGEGNFLTFDTPEQGFQALMADLNAKQTGATRTRLNAGSSLLDLAQVFANSGQTYANTVAQTAGVDINTPIGQIDNFDLARGVAKAEGFTGNIQAGAASTGLTVGEQEFANLSKFEKKSAIQLALSGIPTQLRNSDAEREIFTELAESGLVEGKTPLEIADRLIGFKINKEKDKPFANALRNRAFLSENPNVVKNIARAINNGDRGLSVRILENSLLKESDEQLEITAKTATQRSNELVELLKVSGGDLGPIESRGRRLLQNFISSDEINEINNRMIEISAKTRNELAGATVTPGEEEAIEPILLKPTDSLDRVLIKLAGVKREPLRIYNNARTTRGLPELSEDQLLNQKERVKLYEKQPEQEAQPVQPVTPQSEEKDTLNALLKAITTE